MQVGLNFVNNSSGDFKMIRYKKNASLISGLLMCMMSGVQAKSDNLNYSTQISFAASNSPYNAFYCEIKSQTVTDLQMRNVSTDKILFPGTIAFSGATQINQVNEIYFGADYYIESKESAYIIITYNGDNAGNVQCYRGHGNRSLFIGSGRLNF